MGEGLRRVCKRLGGLAATGGGRTVRYNGDGIVIDDKKGDLAMSPAFVIVWDPEVVPPADYAALVVAIGDLVRAAGGVGIERVDGKAFTVEAEGRP